MINKLTKKWDVYEGNVLDSYGQPGQGGLLFSLPLSIFIDQTQRNPADLRFVNSTHLSLTLDERLKAGYIVTDGEKSYVVEYVISDTRLNQVFLKELI